MSFVGDFLGDTIGGITGAKQAGEAAMRGAELQAESAKLGIDEQRRQFDALINLMSPYVGAGAGAISEQEAIIGLQGPAAQQQAIAGFEQSPLFQALTRQGEDAILQQASATGGLRGGNVQGALAQFRPQVLNSMIEQQYGRLGGLATLGQASAAGQAAQGIDSASNIANLLANRGAALAGGQVAGGNIARNTFGDMLAIGGTAAKFSDIRLKKNIKQIGTRADGLNIYEFDYIWGGERQVGLMAQEVQGLYPDAVSESGGYLMVDYSKV